jgi:hypothetical protein
VHQKAPLQKNEKERGKKNWSPPKIQHSTRPFHDFHVKLQDCPKFCSILLCFSIFFLGEDLNRQVQAVWCPQFKIWSSK